MTPPERTKTTTRELDARCADCHWRTTAPNGLGNAARHHDATGHTVNVNIDVHVVYGGGPTPGQTNLYDLLREGTNDGDQS